MYRIYSVGVKGIDDDDYKDNGSRDDIGLAVAAIQMMSAANNGRSKPEATAKVQNWFFWIGRIFYLVDYEKLFNKLNINGKPWFFMIYYCKKLV